MTGVQTCALPICPGKISAEQAKLYAETEFEKYRIIQDRLFMSDYDKFMLKLEEQTKSLSEG